LHGVHWRLIFFLSKRMTNKLHVVPTPSGKRRSRGAPQALLAGLLLAYLACAWRYAESLWMLLSIETIAPSAALLMMTGTIFLVAGVARTVFDARLGKYLLLLAALQLAVAAPQIGNWEYRLSQGMLAVLVFGTGVALLGLYLSWRAGARG
jgi:hypothetical protein